MGNWNVKPFLISLIITLVIFTGGYYVWQWAYIERPIQTVLQQEPTVQVEQVEMDQKQVLVTIGLDSSTMADDYIDLHQQLIPYTGERQLLIKVKDDPNPTLEQFMDEATFPIREGIENRQYTGINESVKNLSEKKKVRHELKLMDGYLVLALYDEDASLFRAFPLEHEVSTDAK